jgi:cyclophilin family peptidyl-prolyl cis-trans isomerase
MSKKKTSIKCAKIFALFLSLLAFNACEEKPIFEKPYCLIRDANFQSMADAIDNRNSEAFIPFLTHSNPEIQFLAIAHAASLQESAIVPSLFALKTPQAIYAIGQQRDANNLPGLYEILMLDSLPLLTEAALVAIAKSSDSLQTVNLLPFLFASCEINPMWAAFHAISSKGDLQSIVPVAFEQLTCTKPDFRLAAAHFLARSKQLNLTSFSEELFDAWNSEKEIDVKIALSLAFKNSPDPETAGFLNREMLNQGDERVRYNLLRSAITLNVCEEQTLIQMLKDNGTGIAMLAGSTLGSIGWTEENSVFLRNSELNFEGNLGRQKAYLLHANNDDLVYETLIELASKESSPYRKAALLNTMSLTPLAAEYIALHIDSSLPKVVQTTAMDALFNMKRGDLLPANFNLNAAISEGIATQDEGVLAAIGYYLQGADPSDFIDEEQLLREQITYLELPKEVETHNEIVKAINHLYGDSLDIVTPDFNHPINWELLGMFGDTVNVELQTSVGTIYLALYPTLAPGSVGSFVQLALDGFYDGKFYHRVVPDFVVQAGCPRGDGWGGVDYSIRSELAIERYQTGSIGMASAGRDTESCQWFITHCPTPHLDGRYTIFGQVTAGMDVIRNTAVGTTINKVLITQ